ncbi:hypothetical protein LTR04_002952 [Oleoguttula sp. CCFEE 6159]|nr:hypothetical protein LTR04_002952 [Oleoguttula sp. CCFEE 6159]
MSRFVSGGTIDEPVERDDEWLKAQQEIEARRRQKEEESRQQGGKTLFETLQANKAAKQEAFEESIRLKNQFRSLDEDEVEFLDSVLESTRAQESAVKKETLEQLDLFRKQQEEAEKAALSDTKQQSPPVKEEQWITSGKKRKKGREKEPRFGVKLRKSSSTAEKPSIAPPTAVTATAGSAAANSRPAKAEDIAKVSVSEPLKPTSISKPPVTVSSPQAASTPPKTSVVGPATLGLGSCSSDEDD